MHLPVNYVLTAQALKQQSLGFSGKAIDNWIKVGNLTQAELILRKEYLPLHLRHDSDWSTILKFYRPASLSSFSSPD